MGNCGCGRPSISLNMRVHVSTHSLSSVLGMERLMFNSGSIDQNGLPSNV